MVINYNKWTKCELEDKLREYTEAVECGQIDSWMSEQMDLICEMLELNEYL